MQVDTAPTQHLQPDVAARALFVGFIAPQPLLDEAFAKEPAPQVSAAKFQTSFLQGLVDEGVAVEAITALPIAGYPRSNIKVVKSRNFQLFEGRIPGRLIGGVNLPILKLGTRLVKALYRGRQAVRLSAPNVVIVYSLHTPFLLTALYLKQLTGAPAAVFIPDLPMHMHGRRLKGIHGLLKLVDNALLKLLVRRFDLAFPFTKAIGQDWLPSKMPFIVVEGIAPAKSASAVPYTKQNPLRPKLLYTGSFTHVGRFARLFAQCKEIQAELIFVGDGADRAELEEISTTDKRINVVPFVAERELKKLIADADFLLNPRDSRWEGGQYSFPSKLLDYAFRSKPILSTRLPGIGEEYFQYFIAIEDGDVDGLKRSLKSALGLDENFLARRVEKTRQFCEIHKSAQAVAATVMRGFEELRKI